VAVLLSFKKFNSISCKQSIWRTICWY